MFSPRKVDTRKSLLRPFWDQKCLNFSDGSQGGDDASLVSKILDPLASAHYKLPLQKQWLTLVQGRRQLSFVRDPSEGEQITSNRDGLLRSNLPPGGHFNSGNRLLRDSP